MRGDEVEEVILALSATVDGQTTAHYVADTLSTKKYSCKPFRTWCPSRRRTRLYG